MDEAKNAYRFTGPGKHSVFIAGDPPERRLIEEGEIVYLTDAVAEGLKDRFKPAPPDGGRIDRRALDLPAEAPEAPAPAPDSERPQDAPAQAESKAAAVTLEAEALARAAVAATADAVVAGTVQHSVAKIKRVKKLEDLAAVEAAEERKLQPRVGVLRAIDVRRTYLDSEYEKLNS